MRLLTILHNTCIVMAAASTAKGSCGGLRGSSSESSSTSPTKISQAEAVKKQQPQQTHLSIWLIPPEPYRTELQERIDTLAEDHDGPKFTPHITVVGNVPASTPEEEQQVVDQLKTALYHQRRPSVACSFLPKLLSFPKKWNQALIAELDLAEDKDQEFYNLCVAVREATGLPTEDWGFAPPSKLPHLSLYYGTGDNVPSLDNGAGDEHLNQPIESFHAHDIQVVRVTSSLESVPEWKNVGSVRFEV
ncbi:MAG: hypothetical protein SGILL_000775 [Bacillariaceae sp.]